MFVFTKPMGEKLAVIRKKSKLSQKEVAERMGIKSKAGQSYIAQLENGMIKNPGIKTICDYLSICGYPWGSYFNDISAMHFNMQNWKIISQVDIPRHYKKVSRDVAKYQHSIETKFSEKQGLKPLKIEKQEKMALGFLKHRVVIEPIETEVQKLLGELNAPLVSNQFYKAFVRECYRVIKKLTTKGISADSVSLAASIKLNQIIDKWVEKGLDRNILEKVKDIPIRYFQGPAGMSV